MDPDACWKELKESYSRGEWDRVLELAEALLGWLDRGGFPPDTGEPQPLGEDWRRAVSRAAAEFARERARASV